MRFSCHELLTNSRKSCCKYEAPSVEELLWILFASSFYRTSSRGTHRWELSGLCLLLDPVACLARCFLHRTSHIWTSAPHVRPSDKNLQRLRWLAVIGGLEGWLCDKNVHAFRNQDEDAAAVIVASAQNRKLFTLYGYNIDLQQIEVLTQTGSWWLIKPQRMRSSLNVLVLTQNQLLWLKRR